MSSSGNPHPVPKPLPNALPTGLVQGMGQVPTLYFPSQKISKNPLKRSKRRPTTEKRATKKELRVTQMNHSELSNFTQKPQSTLLRKGQNWEQNWDGFGWGGDRTESLTSAPPCRRPLRSSSSAPRPRPCRELPSGSWACLQQQPWPQPGPGR